MPPLVFAITGMISKFRPPRRSGPLAATGRARSGVSVAYQVLQPEDLVLLAAARFLEARWGPLCGPPALQSVQ